MPYELGRTRPESYSIIYDSGDYPALLRQALEDIDYESLKPLIGQNVEGKYHGVGTACFVKSTGTGDPGEGARIVVSNAGGPHRGPLPGERGMPYPGQGEGEDAPKAEVAVYLGITTMGQGHETIFAQISADGLGVPMESITVYHGSTDLTPYGGGTYASRGTTLAGNAVYGAAQKLRERVLAVAAAYLDVDPSELELTAGMVHRKGGAADTDLTLTLPEVLRLAAPASRYNLGEAGLEASDYFQSPQELYPCGAHAVHVAVDPETGEIDIVRYVIVEDVGHVINPAAAERADNRRGGPGRGGDHPGGAGLRRAGAAVSGHVHGLPAANSDGHPGLRDKGAGPGAIAAEPAGREGRRGDRDRGDGRGAGQRRVAGAGAAGGAGARPASKPGQGAAAGAGSGGLRNYLKT